MTIQRIQSYLDAIKRDGKSSPSGIHWNDFFIFLKKIKKPKEHAPLAPLILGASVESDATKHERLKTQLQWALEHDCLDKALEFLKNLNTDQWNTCSKEGWDKDSYPSWDEEYDDEDL